VRDQLLELNELQKMDALIREIEIKREALPKRLNELEKSMQGRQQEIGALKREREVNDQERKTIDGTMQAEALKIRKWEQRLNDIRNHREYLALSREIEAVRRTNRDAEEKILELMQQREDIEKKIEDIEGTLSGEAEDSTAERERVKQELEATNEDYEAKKAQRAEMAPKVERKLLKRYDMIRKKRDGVGLAAVSEGSCQLCNMKLPPQMYNMLQRSNSIEQCPSCQRIIFWEGILETEDAAAENAAVEEAANEEAAVEASA